MMAFTPTQLRIGLLAVISWTALPALGQELEPRAYSISPRGTNFAVIGLVRSSGAVTFDPSLPISDATAAFQVATFGYTRAIGVAGRSANVSVALPYVWGSLSAKVGGIFEEMRRSGLADPAFRLAVNLYGAPAMNRMQFKDYNQRFNLGASVSVVTPLGQYDHSRLLNLGRNRWAVKPEIGLSQHTGPWYFDLYLGVWLYTANPDYFGFRRKEDPLGIAQLHVVYTINPRIWVAFNGNFSEGGRTTIGKIDRADVRHNSRMGGTLAIRIRPQHSIKFAGSTGVATSVGAAVVSIGVAYQYQWGGT